jgi:hypothetical protein
MPKSTENQWTYPFPKEDWELVPNSVKVYIRSIECGQMPESAKVTCTLLEQKFAALEIEHTELKQNHKAIEQKYLTLKNRNSQNSSQPPSATPTQKLQSPKTRPRRLTRQRLLPKNRRKQIKIKQSPKSLMANRVAKRAIKVTSNRF